MDKKTLSIVSYITIIGWLIAYFSNNNSPEKSSLARYHLKQSFGLGILGIAFNIVIRIIIAVIPSLSMLALLGTISLIVSICILILIILGCINASNEKETPLPIIGKMFEDKFDFIK
jgi:uncharacterized membrane protein